MNNKIAALLTGIFVMGCLWVQAGSGGTGKLPNILWLTTEDIGPEIGCYGDKNATTPIIDTLAARGVIYTNAFASAPVCAPARSTIIRVS